MSDQNEKKEQTRPVFVMETDGIDSLMFDSVRDAKKIAEVCATPEGEGVAQDAFTAFFTHEPRIKEESDQVQANVFQQMMQLPEFGSLRAGTKNDEIASALGSAQFAPEMINKIKELRKKMQERQEQARQNGQPVPQSLKEALSDTEMAGLRQALRRNLEKAQEESDKWNDMQKSWGMGKGEIQHLPAEERMALAQKLAGSKKMQRIADLAGRFKNIVNSNASTTPIHGVDEIVDVCLSNDVAHMLPSELTKLNENPDQFYIDYLENKLLTYNLKSVQDVGRGPIICCVDMSGSMGGIRDEWAKAVTLALLQLAQKQRRAFGFIGFDDDVQFKKFFAKDQRITAQERIEIAGMFSGGGTNFYRPLKAAFEMRAKDPSLKPADIIFITDGDCMLRDNELEEIKELKKKFEMRTYSIGIDCYRTETLSHFSDQVAGVSLDGDIQIDLVKDLISKTASKKAVK